MNRAEKIKLLSNIEAGKLSADVFKEPPGLLSTLWDEAWIDGKIAKDPTFLNAIPEEQARIRQKDEEWIIAMGENGPAWGRYQQRLKQESNDKSRKN